MDVNDLFWSIELQLPQVSHRSDQHAQILAHASQLGTLQENPSESEPHAQHDLGIELADTAAPPGTAPAA